MKILAWILLVGFAIDVVWRSTQDPNDTLEHNPPLMALMTLTDIAVVVVLWDYLVGF